MDECDEEHRDAKMPAVVEQRRELVRPDPSKRADGEDHVEHKDCARARRADDQDRRACGLSGRRHCDCNAHVHDDEADDTHQQHCVIHAFVLVPLDPGVAHAHGNTP